MSPHNLTQLEPVAALLPPDTLQSVELAHVSLHGSGLLQLPKFAGRHHPGATCAPCVCYCCTWVPVVGPGACILPHWKLPGLDLSGKPTHPQPQIGVLAGTILRNQARIEITFAKRQETLLNYLFFLVEKLRNQNSWIRKKKKKGS